MGKALKQDIRGVAAVEFALIAPVLLAMLAGIIAYGGWFWMAHNLQQAANDAARAAIAGLTAAERQTLASSAVTQDLGQIAALDPSRAVVTVQETSETVVIHIRYDARGNPFFALNFIPMPPSVIQRVAAIRLPAT